MQGLLQNPRQGNKGFTLAEVLIAMTIAGFMLSASYATILALAKGTHSMANYSEMNGQTRMALEIFGRDARMASAVHTASANQLSFTATGDVIEYEYSPAANTFQRTVNSDPPRVLLFDVEDLHLRYYTLRHDETTRPIEVKHVQLEAKMQRRVLQFVNTNYLLSARFMMRNQDVSQ